MRLLLAGPPKTGNVWVEALLAGAYGLDILRPPDVPGAEAALLDDFVTDGRFPQRSIFHQHFVPSDDVFEVAARHDIRLLAVLRDPYDTFVSLFFYIQRFAADYERSGDHGASLIGCSLGDQAVFDYIRDIYGHHLRVAAGWAAAGRAGRALAVRYEDLHRDTAGSLARIGVALGSPIPLLRRRRAVRAATAGRMRSQSGAMARHIRSATVGDWRHHLDDRHLRALLDHADVIRASGYDVLAPGER